MGLKGWIKSAVLSEGEKQSLEQSALINSRSSVHARTMISREMPKDIKRIFEAAVQTFTNWGWSSAKIPYDVEIATDILSLRGQARDLAKNNDYARNSLWLIHEGVVYLGIWPRPQFKKSKSDELDADVNESIRMGYRRWGEAGSCDVTGRLTWTEVLRLSLQGVVRDGEAFVRKVYGTEHNRTGFALQLIEPDWIDESLNTTSDYGNRIIMGVELNGWGRPVAYYFRQDHAAGGVVVLNQKPYVRIPADEIVHFFWQERADQTRGVPWMRSPNLRMLGLYFAAELAAATSAANKMHFYTKTGDGDGVESAGDGSSPGAGLDKDDFGSFIQAGYPGGSEIVPEGWDVKALDFNHPNEGFDSFVKAQIRSYSGGMGLSYTSVSQDLSDVNYSSLRHTALQERDHYRVMQDFIIQKLALPIYREWLRFAALSGTISVPVSKIDLYRDVEFMARAFAWVDPLREIEAKEKEVKLGINSKSRIVEESGGLYSDVLDQIKNERRREDEAGLVFSDRMEEIKLKEIDKDYDGPRRVS